MNKIQNYNCDGMCHQEYCDKRYTDYEVVIIHDMETHIALCDEHAEEWEENRFKKGEKK